MMQAAWYERTGPAGEVLQLGELETPRPGPGDVLVRVFASGINPSDTKMRALAQIAQSARIGAAAPRDRQSGVTDRLTMPDAPVTEAQRFITPQ